MNFNSNHTSINFKHLNTEDLDLDEIIKIIDEKEYCVCHGLLESKTVLKIKPYWEDFFKQQIRKKPSLKAVAGNFHLGEESFSSYSNDDNWNIYRFFDFYWNKAQTLEQKLTREIALDLHKIKNLLMDRDPLFGLIYSEDREGTYLSVSHYPPDEGFLKFHRDNEEQFRLLQFMVNINYKNRDYSEGGLHFIIDGKKIDIDSELLPGSVLFFNGSLQHGVEPVKSTNEVGRIAFFSIPASFLTTGNVPNFLRFLERVYFGLERRIKNKK